MTTPAKGVWSTDSMKAACMRRTAFDVRCVDEDRERLALAQDAEEPVWIARGRIWVENGPLCALLDDGVWRVYLRAMDYEGTSLVPVPPAQLVRERLALAGTKPEPLFPTATQVQGIAPLTPAHEADSSRVIVTGFLRKLGAKSALFLIRCGIQQREVWLPISQLAATRNASGAVVLSLPRWLAIKEGLDF